MKTTTSGLQYKVLVAGTGATPKATDEVTVKYEGKLIDGTVFDSSYKRNPQTTSFPLRPGHQGLDRGSHHDACRQQMGNLHTAAVGLRRGVRQDRSNHILR